MEFLSTVPLKHWTGSLSIYPSYYDTYAAEEISNLCWDHISRAVTSGGQPELIRVKEYGTYYLVCKTKNAPLVGKTLKKAQKSGAPTIGKMRSASHVTSTTILVIDLDGLTKNQIREILKKLKSHSLTFLCYSTHSFGRKDKPGIRCRLIVPVDMELNAAEYGRALRGAQKLLLDGLADENAFSLSQAQGVWMTSTKRAHLAFCLRNNAGVLHVQTLLDAVPEQPKPSRNTPCTVSEVMFEKTRVSEALAWFDWADYSVWLNTAMWLKAAYGEVARPLWVARSEPDGKYDPDAFWDALDPRIPPEAGAGALFGAAKDRVIEVVKRCSVSGDWSGEGMDALVYLKRFHRAKDKQLFGEGM